MKLGSIDEPTINIEDILDVIPRGHIIFKKVEQEFRDEIQTLAEWYELTTENREQIPYQYKPENQGTFIKSTNIITKLLSHIDPVIMEKYKELYLLEKQTPESQSETPVPMPMPMGMSEGGTNININPEKQKETGIKSFFGIKSKKETDMQSPYRVSLEPIKAKEKILEDWYDLIDFHSYGLIWTKFNTHTGMEHYLDIEKTEFKRRVNRLVTSVNEGINLALRREKLDAVAIVTATSKLEERHRNDFNPNQQNN